MSFCNALEKEDYDCGDEEMETVRNKIDKL